MKFNEKDKYTELVANEGILVSLFKEKVDDGYSFGFKFEYKGHTYGNFFNVPNDLDQYDYRNVLKDNANRTLEELKKHGI